MLILPCQQKVLSDTIEELYLFNLFNKNLHNACYVPGTFLNALYILTSLIHLATLRGRFYIFHFG